MSKVSDKEYADFLIAQYQARMNLLGGAVRLYYQLLWVLVIGTIAFAGVIITPLPTVSPEQQPEGVIGELQVIRDNILPVLVMLSPLLLVAWFANYVFVFRWAHGCKLSVHAIEKSFQEFSGRDQVPVFYHHVAIIDRWWETAPFFGAIAAPVLLVTIFLIREAWKMIEISVVKWQFPLPWLWPSFYTAVVVGLFFLMLGVHWAWLRKFNKQIRS